MNYTDVLAGIAMSSFAGSGLIFLRFWQSSCDRFYLFFAVACALFALDRLVLCLLPEAQGSVFTDEIASLSWVYLIRLAAFFSILFAIIEKNRQSLATVKKLKRSDK